jgi:lysophospholipase L1-like esterase
VRQRRKIGVTKIDQHIYSGTQTANPSGKSRTGPWLFGALTVVLCIAVLWGAAELFVRFVVDDGMQFDLEMWKYARDIKVVSPDPLIGHQHRPHGKARVMGVDLVTNSHGLRDYEYRYERTPDTLRILMLGDSFTEGWGVSLADTFVKRVERLFAKDGTKAEVINTGVGNWNTIQEVEYFLTEGFKYRPDIVVLNFTFNDAEPVPPDKPPGFFMRHCYSCVFLIGRIDTLMREISERRNWVDYYLGLYDHGKAAGWLAAKAYLQKLADYCKSHGIRLLVANFPELHDVKHYRFQEITDLVKQAADQNNVAFIDLLDSVKNEDSSSLWVTPPDPHPNSLADKLFADALYQKLRTLR